MRALLLALATLLALSVFAGAQDVMYKTGNDLFRECSEAEPWLVKSNAPPKEAVSLTSCSAYISGIVDFQSTLNALPNSSHLFCVPPQVRVSQLCGVVLKYLKDNPAERHGVAAAFVVAALADVYPCK